MSQLSFGQAMQLAVGHHQAGRLGEAEAAYRQILAVQPNQPDALAMLGVLAAQMGRHDAAERFFQQAIKFAPANPDHHLNLALVLEKQGKLDQAVESCRQAVQISPGSAQAHNHLGVFLRKLGAWEQAIISHQRAIELQPGFAWAYNNLGNALQEKRSFGRAIAAYEQALLLGGNDPKFLCGLGKALKDSGQLDRGLDCYQRALAARGDDADALCGLAGVYQEIGRSDQAIRYFRRALELDPTAINTHDKLLYALLYDASTDPGEVVLESRRWNLQHASALISGPKTHSNDRDANRRLKVGYVSADFRSHSASLFFLPLLIAHDPQQVEVYCYSNVAQPDPVTATVQNYSKHWRSIVGWGDDKAAEQIHQDGIDILVDLSGHSADHRLLVFARKPAPIQITYLGYPATTGLATIDYRMTDGLADPPGMTENQNTETLLRLNQSAWCYHPPTESPPIAGLPAAQNNHVTFCSFNNFAKASDMVLALWMQILRAVPASRLLIKSKSLDSVVCQQRVKHQMAIHGITDDRVEVTGWVSAEDHFRKYAQADISLDTYPYHGTTTTCESLWMGVPVITLAGQTHVARVGVSLLTDVGLPELVARTPQQYLRLAVDLAADLPRLVDLRSNLRQRMQASPLMDGPGLARRVEDAYRQVWQNWCAAQAKSKGSSKL